MKSAFSRLLLADYARQYYTFHTYYWMTSNRGLFYEIERKDEKRFDTEVQTYNISGYSLTIWYMSNEKYIETWRGYHNGLSYEIVRWDYSSPIWNSYIFIPKTKLSKNDFKIFNLQNKKYQITPNSPVRIFFDYSKLEAYFNMSGWITWYSKEYDSSWALCGIKIGNDYNHIWNGWEDFETVKEDVVQSINLFLSKISLQ